VQTSFCVTGPLAELKRVGNGLTIAIRCCVAGCWVRTNYVPVPGAAIKQAELERL
jgi:hypothetical protein